MKKLSFAFTLFMVMYSAILITVVTYTGLGNLLSQWWESGSIYILGIIFSASLLYLFWSLSINRKYAHHGKLLTIDDERVDPEADRNLSIAICPQCEEEGHYYSTESGEGSFALVCWKCHYTFSDVWCENCGMGGDFVDMHLREPPTWTCPECDEEYPLPMDFYENPIHLKSWENLGNHQQVSFQERQRSFKLNQAKASIWLLASILLSYTLIQPLLTASNDTLSKLNVEWVNGESPSMLLSCVLLMILFVGTWYSFVLFPLAMMKIFDRLRSQMTRREKV